MISIFIFIFGACVGSFLNVCIYRLPRNLSVVRPRSFCPRCSKPIVWYDNIPLASYIFLRGQCRHCRLKISFRYFFVEAMSALLTLLIWIQGVEKGLPWGSLIGQALLTYALVVVTWVDFEFSIIPNEITYSGFAAALLMAVLAPAHLGASQGWEALARALLGALAGGGSLWLVGWAAKFFVKKEAMGLGDVKLMAMAGAWLGWKAALCSIMLASLIGSAVGLSLVVFRRVKMEGHIPFGPFLSMGVFIFMMWGDEILRWYIEFLYDLKF